ncbi:MAG: ATP-binding protein [Selenomonadaceae bacterium]|nr:ATP-binding protein [Selenomonadaceae bacterium]
MTFERSGTLVNKKFREFFIPTVLASMASQLGTIINGIIVGNLISSQAMAAVSACVPLNQVTYAMAVLISIGSAGLIAVAAGKRQNDDADYIFSTVVTISIFAGIIWAICLIPNSAALTKFLSSAEDLRPMMHDYLIIFVFRLPLYLMFFSWQTLMRTDGFAKVVSRGIMIGQFTNVALSFTLVSNGFGVTGAAIALLCSDVIGICYMLRKYFPSSERNRKFRNVISDFGKFVRQSAEVIKSGIPVACSTGLISVKIWAIYQILGETGGSDAMTLYAICMACLSVVSMFISGCNGAMMPIVGILYGEKDFGGVRILVKYVLKFALTLSGIFVAFTQIFPQVILSLYNIPSSLVDSGETALRLFSISLLGVTLTFLAMYYYSTIQRRTAANVLSWTEGIIVVVPAAWILSKSFGLSGVWLAFILAEVVGFGVIFMYTKMVCKNSGGKLNDIFLIEHSDPEILLDVSFQADADTAAKISHDAKAVLEQKGFDSTVALKVGVALEEMTLNIEKLNAGQKIDVDLRLKRGDGKIIIALRDNGKTFNPLEYSVAEEENLHTDGIMLLKNLAGEIKYNRVLALNQTLIEI